MFDLVDGEMKPDDKICIDNKSMTKDGPPLDLQINNEESGEQKILLNLAKFIY